MRLEGALLLSHAMNPKANAMASVVKDTFVFVVQQANGATLEPEESPSGIVRLTIYEGIKKEWDYSAGKEVLHFDFEVEQLLLPDTQYQLKNPLFDCQRFIERVFGLEEDEYWKPLL